MQRSWRRDGGTRQARQPTRTRWAAPAGAQAHALSGLPHKRPGRLVWRKPASRLAPLGSHGSAAPAAPRGCCCWAGARHARPGAGEGARRESGGIGGVSVQGFSRAPALLSNARDGQHARAARPCAAGWLMLAGRGGAGRPRASVCALHSLDGHSPASAPGSTSAAALASPPCTWAILQPRSPARRLAKAGRCVSTRAAAPQWVLHPPSARRGAGMADPDSSTHKEAQATGGRATSAGEGANSEEGRHAGAPHAWRV